MPIRAEMRARYPADWALRSRFVREVRARNRCEWCGVANHAVGYRDETGCFHPDRGSVVADLAGRGISYPSMRPITYTEARAIAACRNEGSPRPGPRYIVIVLTCAHVFDDRPEAASLLNLAALCQRCHNVLDAPRRAYTRRSHLDNHQASWC